MSPRPDDASPLRTTKWGGHHATRWSKAVLARYGTRCALQLEGCTQVATTADHIIPRSQRPDLAYDVTNGRPACRRCNSKRGTDPHAAAPTVDDRAFFETVARRGVVGGPSTELDGCDARANRE